MEPSSIVARAREEAEVWFHVNKGEDDAENSELRQQRPYQLWSKPLRGWVKCNIGVSWLNANLNCGVAWIIQDDQGSPLFHGRRSFSLVESRLEAEFLGLFWVAESISNLHQHKVMFEITSRQVKEAILQPKSFPKFRQIISQIKDGLASMIEW